MKAEKTYTAEEAKALAVQAAEEALARFAASSPLPSAVTAGEAAAMLGVSRSTIARMNLPRNRAGRIPYVELRRAIAAR
jgi:hypothetical protein